MIGIVVSPGRRKYACSECTTRSPSALRVGVRAVAPEEVGVECLDVQELDELRGGRRHDGPSILGRGERRQVRAAYRPGTPLALPFGTVQAGQELLELAPDLLTGRDRLVLGEQAAALLRRTRERVVLLLERLDDLEHLAVGREIRRDLLAALSGGLT